MSTSDFAITMDEQRVNFTSLWAFRIHLLIVDHCQALTTFVLTRHVMSGEIFDFVS